MMNTKQKSECFRRQNNIEILLIYDFYSSKSMRMKTLHNIKYNFLDVIDIIKDKENWKIQ